ncbi:MAG: CvpA family protein, partial [Oscillospiraceae bacterium]|nr:CvpA family protein [Oscillospiraceae bacterium]
MGEKFWWIYDILSAAVIIFFIYRSVKKGFSKILIKVAGCVVSFILALVISKHAAGFVYDKFIKETSMNAVKEAMDEYDPSPAIKKII